MKESIRKGCGTVCMVIVLLSFSISVLGYGHRYDTGFLESITTSSNEIVINGKIYRLKSGVKVILKVKEKGAYYERIGRLSDLNRGDRIFLKVFGPNDVLEIEVMR